MVKCKIQDNKETLTITRNFLTSTLRKLMSILGAECGSFFLFDPEKDELVLDSFFNSSAIDVKDIKRRVGEGVSGKVIQINSPILVRNIDEDMRFRRNGYNHYHTKSFIAVPLFCCDSLVGLINIADKSSGEPFSERDLLFAETICKYACTIVENLLDSTRLNQEKEKLAKQKALLEKYATVGKLAAGVVHEVNNPLDGIIRYANILLTHIDHNSAAREYLLEIKKGLGRIGTITKSLLEFSHLINSDQPKFKRYVNLCDLMDESLETLKEKISGNIKIIKKYDSCLPKVLDIGIAHVLINIIKNAIDAMPDGGALEITAEVRDSCIYISFKDTGIGICMQDKEKIFEPFFSTKAIDKGTGLGLAISKEIVNKYEGTIEVESAQGAGSTFTVLIPDKYLENA
jgi:signal transduction histidine kinase